jgi:outer membrane protein OmpA-like peptidoglycan-associated protein
MGIKSLGVRSVLCGVLWVGAAGAAEQGASPQPRVRVQVEHEGWEAWQRQARDQAAALRDAEQRAQRAEQRLEQLEAEARTRESLEGVAAVKEDERGLVLTLTGSVLFEFDRAELLPSASRRLDAVAEALNAQPEGQELVVAGYTDSVGAEGYNEQLSLARAVSVREFLVKRGVDPERIRVQGYGESSPVADNRTSEGRANNRRVEIVLPRTGVGGAGEEDAQP